MDVEIGMHPIIAGKDTWITGLAYIFYTVFSDFEVGPEMKYFLMNWSKVLLNFLFCRF